MCKKNKSGCIVDTSILAAADSSPREHGLGLWEELCENIDDQLFNKTVENSKGPFKNYVTLFSGLFDLSLIHI